ncbi:MAG: glycosyltransferase family 2 protein [Elusimicrobia bacterium]|nr:glycosyltransferase family 2 protein [Elusimicrobiota bacterium]
MLSALVPCLDELAALPRLEAELYPALASLNTPWEVLFVDDGSRDGTGDALRALAGRHPGTRVLAHPETRGIGASLKTGLAAAKGDWLVFLDADLTFHPSLIESLLDARQATGADCVSGSPARGGMGDVPLSRRLPSLAMNFFYRGLFDATLTAFTPMFRLYRVSDLRELDIRSDGFEVSVEVLVKLLRAGKRVVEVPAPLTTRAAGSSKLRAWRELKAHARLAARLLAPRRPAH